MPLCAAVLYLGVHSELLVPFSVRKIGISRNSCFRDVSGRAATATRRGDCETSVRDGAPTRSGGQGEAGAADRRWGGSGTLVARMLGAGETKWETWYKSFYNFLDPFDKTLWFMILGFIIFSGVVDWLVERKSVKEARVTSSIYEYFAGLCGDARLEPSSCTTSSSSHRSTHA